MSGTPEMIEWLNGLAAGGKYTSIQRTAGWGVPWQVEDGFAWVTDGRVMLEVAVPVDDTGFEPADTVFRNFILNWLANMTTHTLRGATTLPALRAWCYAEPGPACTVPGCDDGEIACAACGGKGFIGCECSNCGNKH